MTSGARTRTALPDDAGAIPILAAFAEASARDWAPACLALSVHRHNAATGRFHARPGFDGATEEQPMTLSGPHVAAIAGSRKVVA